MKFGKFFIFAMLFITITLFAQSEVQKYSMIEMQIPSEELVSLQKLGIALDCSFSSYAKGIHTFIIAVTEYDKKILKKHGFKYQLLVEDAAKHYAARATKEDLALAKKLRKTYDNGMQLGSMGGFYTVEEAYQALDNLYEKYGKQKLISKRASIGKTLEKRDIYVVKISDNADKDESKIEPQALYTCLIHAREPAGMMAVFYFMHYLLENYETDSRVHHIVNNRELFFIPIVNVDGYAYNQKTNPSGGGMRRKNCNGNGVDLNRNFGPRKFWDHPNGGSSTSSWSQTYRGTSEFSEPATQALRDFCQKKKFIAAINYHTYSNLLIFPWGFENKVPDQRFRQMAKEMTRINGYRYGTAPELLYGVRGNSDDWFYEAFGTFAFTPEVGSRSDGFWPQPSRIFPLAEENLEANLLLAEYAGTLVKKAK